MKTKALAVAVMLTVGGICGTAYAQGGAQNDAVPLNDAANAPPPPVASQDQKDDPQQQILCRTLAPATGTRLGARKVCQTRAQWEDQEQRSQHALDKIQQKSKFGNPSGS